MSRDRLVKRAEEFGAAVSDMREAMDKVPENQPERTSKLTEFQKKYPNATYLEPAIRIPTQGKRHAEMEKQRAYLTEYVVGIFESAMITGKLEFYLSGLPGDDYCKWIIPVNKPVGIPRFVAQHLSKGLGWKEMKPLGKGNEPNSFYEEEMMKPFGNFEYKKRGTFHPIDAY